MSGFFFSQIQGPDGQRGSLGPDGEEGSEGPPGSPVSTGNIRRK